MSDKEKEEWLFIYEDDYHLETLVGSHKVKIEVLQPGTLSDKISEENIQILMEGNKDRDDGFWDYT